MSARHPDSPSARIRHPASTGWVGALVAGVVVLVLGLLIALPWNPLIDFDATVSRAVVRTGRGTDVDVLHVLTFGGDVRLRWILMTALAVGLLLARHWRLAVFALAGGVLVSPLNRLIKSVADRPRPTYAEVELLRDTSYPSGHASGGAALAAVLVVIFWPVLGRLGRTVLFALATLFAFVVGATRVALGVHYPSDVVAGWAVAIGWVLLVAVVLQVWPGQARALGPRQSGRTEPEEVS